MGMGGGSYMQMAGSIMQSIAALSDAIQMRRQFHNEANRQAAYQKQALGDVNQAIGTAGVGQAQQDMAAGAAQRQGDYAAVNATPMAFGDASQGSASAGRDAAYSAMQGANRAQLGSYSDWSLQQAIRNLDTQRKLNQVGSFAAGTAQVFPYRMYQAQHAFDDLSAIGQGLSGGGNALSLIGSVPQQQQQQGPLMPSVYQDTTYGTGYAAPAQTYFNPISNQSSYDPYNMSYFTQ